MPTDRPMSEYEAALFTAVTILGQAVLKLGASETDILTELRHSQAAAQLDNRKKEAATLASLIHFLCEPPRHYVPREPK